MRACRDTFTHFLADNLPGITVHPVRRDKDDPSSGTLQMNAINVQFLKDVPTVHTALTTVSIDVVFDNELDAVETTRTLFTNLSAAYFTPKFTYQSGSPVAVGSNIMWEPNRISFKSVYSDYYYHYSCLLVLEHHPV